MKPFIAPVSLSNWVVVCHFLAVQVPAPGQMRTRCQIHRHLRDSDRAQSSSSHECEYTVMFVSWYTSVQTRPPLYSSEAF